MRNQLEKIEDSLAGTDECVVDIYALEEKLDDRVIGLERRVVELEEGLNAVKVQNIELKNDLNSLIRKLNGITDLNVKTDELI